MKTRIHIIYEFGPYRLDLAERRLTRDGRGVTLRPRLFDLLVVLVENRGRMLEKDELLSAVWPDAEVEENNLSVSVSALRKALGDDHYIENVTRHGYRFTPAVKLVKGETAASGASSDTLPISSFEPPGGALPLQSRFYIKRPTDTEFNAAMARRDSVVLVKGARQVGKTSLLARGLQQAREEGMTVVLIDFQHLATAAFESLEKLLLMLAETIADKLELDAQPHESWNNFLSPTSNFERYLRREVLAKISTPLVWAMDEVDRLFNFDFAGEIFGLFRSWHNLRALDPGGPWPRLTLALAYATEAHLFISDLNQSPFNVGTRLMLDDFTPDQVAELNHLYDEPLQREGDKASFFALLGGHPYLTQRGLYEMAHRKLDYAAIEAQADHDEGVFGDHLQRMLISLERDRELRDSLRDLLQGKSSLSTADFYRLRSAGVLSGDSLAEARPRCELYARYLKQRLL